MFLQEKRDLTDQPAAATQNKTEITKLESGKAIVRQISGVEEHRYQVMLNEGQYVSAVVEQSGIDVVVQLLGTDGGSIIDFDSEARMNAEEKMEFLAETSGSCLLLVKAKYPKLPSKSYEIRIIDVVNASDQDRLLYEARKLETKTTKHWRAGKYDEALQLGEEALELLERRWGKEHSELIYVLLNLCTIYYLQGNYEKAEQTCQRAMLIAEKTLGPENLHLAQALHHFGNVAARSEGGEARAEQSYQRAVSIREKVLGADHPLVANTLYELAAVNRMKGNFVQAEQFLQRAVLIIENALGEDAYLASGLCKLGDVYLEKGDYLKAERVYQRGLAIFEKKNHPYFASCSNNLALLYRQNGEYDRAEHWYQRSLSVKEKLVGPDHADLADTRGNIAFLYYARGDYEKAKTMYVTVLENLEKALGRNNPTVGQHLNYLADIYFASNEYRKAEELYRRAQSILESSYGPNYYQLADIFVNLSKMSLVQGEPSQAVKFQAQANAIIEHNLELNLTTGSDRQKIAYLASLSEKLDHAISLHARFAPNDPEARGLAVGAILQRKGRVQDALSDSIASMRSRSGPEDRLLLDQLNVTTTQLARLVLNGPQGVSLVEHQRRINSREDEREKIESEISIRSTGYYVQSKPVTLAAIQATIPENAALIELAVYRAFDPKANYANASGNLHYVAYIIRKNGEVQWTEIGDVKSIDPAIDAFRESLRDPKNNKVKHSARTVFAKILQPVLPLVNDATHLMISPDGPLNLISFESLVDEQNRYLVERFSFTYLTSGRDLLRLQVARKSMSNPVVFADPLFGEPELIATAELKEGHLKSSQNRKTNVTARRQSIISGTDLSDVYFAPLPGTAQEASVIKTLFAEASVLNGANATEVSLKQISAPSILHIATHGFFLTDDPGSPANAIGEKTRAINASAKIENPLLRSGLALSGANLHKRTGDDGILTALEASGLNLWGTKLVTLSACDTGLGEVKNGEGVYGLRRAFVLAGTETLVMSLWPVSDLVTREMMTSYYKGLKQGLGRNDALRQVQLRMLKHKGRAHPFYWASFIQSGEWANLDGKR